MTIAPRGAPVTLTAYFTEYQGGPATDVTNLQLTVVSLIDESTLFNTSVINHIETGLYAYTYDVPAALPLGSYAATWSADEGSAVEIFTVVEAMAGMGVGPCDIWEPVWTCLDAINLGVTGQALQSATEVLWSLSGQQFGLCTTVLRPCRAECRDALWPAGSTLWPNIWPGQTYPMPFWWQGQWLNLTCATCTTGCSCNVVSEFKLSAPVHDIVEILIDGVLLPSTAYRLDENRIVVRTDGGEWPICNDLSKNATEVGTWSVTARYGVDVPELGKLAVGELACEFAKALSGDECNLPQPIQSLSRQGVNITYVDAQQAYGQGHIGLRFSDMFISTFNPSGLKGRSRVYDVDGSDGRRTG